ncbi:MAG: hypothetical protein WBW73_14670 [Rhodoplanes sp.]
MRVVRYWTITILAFVGYLSTLMFIGAIFRDVLGDWANFATLVVFFGSICAICYVLRDGGDRGRPAQGQG